MPPPPPPGVPARASVLVINPDLPRYGSRFHEFINTTALADGFDVGLVTLAFEADAPAAIARLERAGVRVFAPAAGPAPPPVSSHASSQLLPRIPGKAALREAARGTLASLAGAVFRATAALHPVPADVVLARRTLRVMAAPLAEALAARSWDRIVLVQSQFAEWLDVLPPTVPRLLVLHDIRTVVRRRAAAVGKGGTGDLPRRLLLRLEAAR
ncbi:MAG: hypothetical protein RL490_1724, partial [Pseudomonadota bacterium]